MADLDDKIDFSLGRNIITINYLKLNFSAITVWGLNLLLLKSKTSHNKRPVYCSECSFISIAQLTQFKAIHQSVSHYLIEELEVCQGLDFCCIRENDVATRCFILPTLVEWMCIGVRYLSDQQTNYYSTLEDWIMSSSCRSQRERCAITAFFRQ